METSELLELIERGEDSQTQFKERFESIDALAAEICPSVIQTGEIS